MGQGWPPKFSAKQVKSLLTEVGRNSWNGTSTKVPLPTPGVIKLKAAVRKSWGLLRNGSI
jgi:hypothetical protein